MSAGKPIGALLLVLLLTACGDSLTDYVNAKFPPVSAEDQQKAVVQASAAALNALAAPNLSFGVALAEVQEHLLTTDLVKKGIKSITLISERQLIKATIGFDRTFAEDEGGDLIKALKPRVAGAITVLAGLRSAVVGTGETGDTVLRLKVLPVFETVQVKKVEVGGSYDVTALGSALAAVLERFAGNISGALADLDAMEVVVPTGFAEKTDPSRVVRIQSGGFDGDVVVTGQPVGTPINLRGVAFAVADSKLLGLAQFAPLAGVAEATTERPPVAPTEEAVTEAFRHAVRDGFGLETYPDKVWAAVRKDLVSYAVNEVVRQAKLCAKGNGSIARQEFSQQLTFPDESSVDCTPTRDCSPKRTCDFTKSHDDRNCEACILRNYFTGGCSQRGNDMFCEMAKVAQNKIYDADYAGKKLDCERLKGQEKLSCEIEKSGEKALCELGKEALKRLVRTGKFANINGSFQGMAELATCLSGFALSHDLSEVVASLNVEGNAKGDLHVKFVPLDIVGHLTCQVPWTEDQNMRASVPPSVLPVKAGIHLAGGPEGPRYEFAVQEASVTLNLDPGPTEYMMKSVNMTLACQGLDLLKPLILSATPFVPQLKGEFEYKIKASNVAVALKTPKVNLAGHPVAFGISETPQALILQAVVGPTG